MERYKPAREAYAYAATALKAGCRAAFVRRPEKALNPRADEPDIAADDLVAVAERIVEHDA